MKKNLVCALVAGALAVSAVSARAQLNLTGGTVVGSLINQTLFGTAPSSNVGHNNGSVSSWVVSGATADPSGLIFIYQIINSGLGPIDNAEFTGFPGPDVIQGAGETGSYASLINGGILTGSAVPSASGNFPTPAVFGGTVTFENGNMANGGADSYYLAVLTTDHSFANNFGQTQDGFSTAGEILAPVPEASTVMAGALMLLPLGGAIFRALRKDPMA